jgi:DNA-binding Xre family transcriptional regulator
VRKKLAVDPNHIAEAAAQHQARWAFDAAEPSGRSGHGRRGWSLRVEVLERERILRGWIQRELARKVHLDPGTLSDLLARRRRPTFGTVQAVCTSLNLTLAEVIAFEADLASAAS